MANLGRGQPFRPHLAGPIVIPAPPTTQPAYKPTVVSQAATKRIVFPSRTRTARPIVAPAFTAAVATRPIRTVVKIRPTLPIRPHLAPPTLVPPPLPSALVVQQSRFSVWSLQTSRRQAVRHALPIVKPYVSPVVTFPLVTLQSTDVARYARRPPLARLARPLIPAAPFTPRGITNKQVKALALGQKDAPSGHVPSPMINVNVPRPTTTTIVSTDQGEQRAVIQRMQPIKAHVAAPNTKAPLRPVPAGVVVTTGRLALNYRTRSHLLTAAPIIGATAVTPGATVVLRRSLTVGRSKPLFVLAKPVVFAKAPVVGDGVFVNQAKQRGMFVRSVPLRARTAPAISRATPTAPIVTRALIKGQAIQSALWTRSAPLRPKYGKPITRRTVILPRQIGSWFHSHITPTTFPEESLSGDTQGPAS